MSNGWEIGTGWTLERGNARENIMKPYEKMLKKELIHQVTVERDRGDDMLSDAKAMDQANVKLRNEKTANVNMIKALKGQLFDIQSAIKTIGALKFPEDQIIAGGSAGYGFQPIEKPEIDETLLMLRHLFDLAYVKTDHNLGMNDESRF